MVKGLRFIPVLASLLLGGCSGGGDDRPERVKVSGVVRYKQQPVEGATVLFNPQGSTQAAVGVTDKNGKFDLMTFDPADGAVPGNYMVTIRKIEVTSAPMVNDDDPAPPTTEESKLPDKYGNPQSSGFIQTVALGEPLSLTFDLEEGPITKTPSAKRSNSASIGE